MNHRHRHEALVRIFLLFADVFFFFFFWKAVYFSVNSCKLSNGKQPHGGRRASAPYGTLKPDREDRGEEKCVYAHPEG